MPLQTSETPHYIKRTKLYTTYNEVIPPGELLGPPFIDNEYELPRAVQNVVGIELRNYNMEKTLSPTFIGRYRSRYPIGTVDESRLTVAGNHMFDMRMTESWTGNTSTVTIDMGAFLGGVPATNVPILSLGNLLFTLALQVNYAVATFGAPIVAANYNISIGSATSPTLEFTMQEIAAPFRYVDIELLFATGPNEADSMHRVLGFDKVDTVPDPVNGGAKAPYFMNITPFRYYDVTIKEFPEFQPFARIFIDFDNLSQPVNPLPKCVRMLTRPVQRIDKLTIQVRLEGDRPVGSVGEADHEMEVEVLSLEPYINTPGWVDQEFII